VPRNDKTYTEEIHFAWDVPVGDVSPGWCIVYFGNALWFPQRVLRVDVISEDWQRVWTLGDALTRDIWHTEDGDDALEDEYESRDNGYTSGWSYDKKSEPVWEEGPFYPLQTEPLESNIRRFVLDKFNIAGECPKCDEFGKRIIYGLPSRPVASHFIVGGCTGLEGMDGKYGCDCGYRWSVDAQGRAAEDMFADFTALLDGEVDAEHSEGGLNYDLWGDDYPYGEVAQRNFDDHCMNLLEHACEIRGEPFMSEDGTLECPQDLQEHYLGETFDLLPIDPYDEP